MGENGTWPTQTFSWGQATITVSRRTVAMSIAALRIGAALETGELDPAEEYYVDVFIGAVVQSTVEGLDVAFPAAGAGPEDWRRAYQAFQRMDGLLLDRWIKALREVNAPYADREFWPSHLLSEDERKNRASAGSPSKTTPGATSPSSSTNKPAT